MANIDGLVKKEKTGIDGIEIMFFQAKV